MLRKEKHGEPKISENGSKTTNSCHSRVRIRVEESDFKQLGQEGFLGDRCNLGDLLLRSIGQLFPIHPLAY